MPKKKEDKIEKGALRKEEADVLLADFWDDAGGDDKPAGEDVKDDKKAPTEDDKAEGEEDDEEADEDEGEEEEEKDADDGAAEAVRASMMAQIEQFKSVGPQASSVEGIIAAERKAPDATQTLQLEPVEFMPADAIDLEEPAKLARVLNEALNKVRLQTFQDTIRSMSPAVNRVVSDSVNLNIGVAEFYRQNSDLVKYKPYVAMRATQLMSQNQGWPLDKLFTELGKEVRRELNIAVRQKAEKQGKKKMLVKHPSANRQKADSRTPQQKQIDELLRDR